jgi:peptide/nickel transport system substrate-binding protein
MTMSLHRRTLIKLAGGSTVAMLAGLGPVAVLAAQDAGAGGELVIGKGQEAVGLDPAIVTAVSSFDLITLVYERLVEFDEAGEPQPMLAESWELPDDLTYVFTLRPDVTFHNGQPLTAADVKHTFDRIKDEATASPRVAQFTSVDAIEATDDLTVTFHLSAPYGPFLATLASGFSSIVPADDTLDLQAEMVGTGPFMLESWQQDTETVLTAFADYRVAEEPKLSTLRYLIMPEESARLAAIRTGEIQLTAIADPLTVESAQQSEGVEVLEQDTTDYYLLGLNCAEPPFDDPKVRQALSLAIDRQAIVDAVFFGRGQVSGPVVPTLGEWAQPVEDLPNYAVDRERAQLLLEEAGAGDLSFTILVGSLYQEFENIALVIQDQLAEIGVTAELEPVEWGTFIDRWIARDFQGFVSFNSGGNDPDGGLYSAFITDGGTNAFQFSDEQVDQLLEEGRTTTDPEARRETYREVETLLAEQAPAIFIATRVGFFAVRDTVSGFEPTVAQTWSTLATTTVTAEG